MNDMFLPSGEKEEQKLQRINLALDVYDDMKLNENGDLIEGAFVTDFFRFELTIPSYGEIQVSFSKYLNGLHVKATRHSGTLSDIIDTNFAITKNKISSIGANTDYQILFFDDKILLRDGAYLNISDIENRIFQYDMMSSTPSKILEYYKNVRMA